MIFDNDQIIQTAQQILKVRQQPSSAVPPIVMMPTAQTMAQSASSKLSDEKELEALKKRQEIDQQDKRFTEEMAQRQLDRDLKKKIATEVFRFLAVETGALFIVVLLQGFQPLRFRLEDSTINIFLGATLLQISSMAVIITRHLYPTTEKQ